MSNDAPVEVSEEQREAAERIVLRMHVDPGWKAVVELIARAFAERDRAAELREREACAAHVESVIGKHSGSWIAAAIRARSK